MEDILAITLIFGGGSAFLLAISPIGRAIADRIRGSGGKGDQQVDFLAERQDDIVEELESVRRELADIHERLEFTERLMARERHDRLQPGQDVHD